MAVFVVLVEVVALPVSAPVNPVDVTEVKPARVVELPPKEMAVVPIVRLLFERAVLGIFVKPDPEPTNPVAVKRPEEGTKESLVEVVF